MRGVLPRELAAGVITGAVSRMAWAVGGVSIVLTLPMLIEIYLEADRAADLPLPIALLLFQLAILIVAARLGRPVALVGYLILGSAAVTGFQLAVIDHIPGALDQFIFLLNRPVVALVLVGVTAPTTLVGVSWILVGLGFGVATFATTSLIRDVPFATGAGPFFVAIIAIVGYATLAAIQARLRGRLPNFAELEIETRRLQRGENLSRTTTAVVHDTLLNDLAFVMNAPDRLDARAAERLRNDLDTLTSAEWLTTANEVVAADEQDVQIRNALMRMVSEFQWRGLSIRVTGSGSGVYRMTPSAVAALTAAIRAAFENVLRHSGSDTAEFDLAYTDESVTVMITDQGAGFDASSIPDDRLGIRSSIVDRVEDAGGRVNVWSTPGVGTSVMLVVPVDLVTPHERSDHGRIGLDPQFPASARAITVSPQQIDPLSWFTGPFVPLVFAGMTLIYGVFGAVLQWFGPRHTVGLEFVALLFCVASHLIIQFAASSIRQSVTVWTGITALALSSTGVILSAIGYVGVEFRVELWWGPIALALTMGSLGPYLAARTLVILGSAATLVTVPISVFLLGPRVGEWGTVSSIIIIGYSAVVGVILTSMFSALVAGRTLRLLERRSQTVVREQRMSDEAERVERKRLAGLTARAVPFIEDVLQRGAVSPTDRTLAGQISRQLRDDLVALAARTWLDEMVSGSGVTVLDHGHLANRLRTQQRTALRGLVRDLLDSEEIDQGSLLIELRAADDGATAVAVSLDLELPEGRRIVHLRPHILRLRMTADVLEWDPDSLQLSFRFPQG